MAIMKLREPREKLGVRSLGESIRNSEPEVIFALKDEFLEENNMEILLKYNPYLIIGLLNPTFNMCLSAVKADGELYAYVTEQLKSDITIKLAALKQNPYAIEQMIQFDTATDDLIDLVVQINPKTIKVIFSGTELLSAIHYMNDYYKFNINSSLETEMYTDVFDNIINMAICKRRKDKTLKNYRELLLEWYVEQI